jgi:hypothetical protein
MEAARVTVTISLGRKFCFSNSCGLPCLLQQAIKIRRPGERKEVVIGLGYAD